MKVLVLGVQFYDFKGKEGNQIDFAKVHYVCSDVVERNTVGLVVSELNLSTDVAIQFGFKDSTNVPSFYDFTFETQLDYRGKPIAKLVKVLKLDSFDINKISSK